MKLGIMQPYLFPYLGYWQLLNLVDEFVIYDDVNYIKQGYINRNSILINGESRYITLQLSQAGSFKKINQIEIGANRSCLIKTIRYNYSRSKYFETVMPVIDDILSNTTSSLSEFIEYSIRNIASFLNIKTKILISSQIDKNNLLSGQDKVIEICKNLNATEYINSIGGQSLYSKEAFQKDFINLQFIKSHGIEYKQFGMDFVPNLSIIDLMMFNSVEKIGEFLDSYELV